MVTSTHDFYHDIEAQRVPSARGKCGYEFHVCDAVCLSLEYELLNHRSH